MAALRRQLPRQTLRKAVQLLLSLLPIPTLLLLRPLGLHAAQCFVLGALVTVIVWWVTGLVERTAASLMLLAVFLLFSGAPAATVLTFPRSENFLMIVLSFLFSQGIANSGLVERLLQPLLLRFAKTLGRLMALMALSAFLMIFIIPQPFSRIIVLSLIFKGYFDKISLDSSTRCVLLFGLFAYSALLNMMMLRGDIILNNALLTMGGVPMTERTWTAYMAPPTLVLVLLSTGLFLVVFRKELAEWRTEQSGPPAGGRLDRRETLHLILIAAVVLLWALEELHGVSGTIITAAGTAAMFFAGLLKLPDLKSVNIRLLVFLTAAFAIGGVLKEAGIADVLFQRLAQLFPGSFSLGYAALVLVIAMAMHMLLGSNVTTMSVVAPGLMAVGAGVVADEALLLLIYLGICGHFVLPFHHVLLLLGEGDGCYTSRHMIRFGLPLTLVTLFYGLFVYMSWWRILGLL